MSNKIVIPLPNGYQLVAEQNTDPAYSKEIFIGITDGNGGWWQDLAVVRPALDASCAHGVHWENEKFEVLVYSDKGDEDYTHKFSIGLNHGGL